MLILELGSLAVFAEVNFAFMPFILEQKDFLLLAALEPFFNLDGLVVTAVFNLDPGLAFGTGSHPTTSLCLNWLDNNLIPSQHIIDYLLPWDTLQVG